MMNFYSSIAEYYNEIFPCVDNKVDFLGEYLIDKNDRILDIGCATGELAGKLFDRGYFVTGLDLDEENIKIARKNHPRVFFVEENMLNISSNYVEGSFGLITCFGNTIVHLNKINVQSFFDSVFLILKNSGVFIFQILNYDNIYANNISSLPRIENRKILFERDYVFEDNHIKFNTKLTIKSSGDVINNTAKLFPIFQSEIQKMLKKSGFEKINLFSSYERDELSEKKLPLIVVCHKK